MSARRGLLLATLLLAFVVVVVGAYVRLSDAGLGCPDWPLCYGQPLPGSHLGGDALGRAWKEMAHRYLAGTLGLLIFVGVLVESRRRRAPRLATALLLVVLFQATLGMWTVTLLLRPAIVTAHLLGGMATLALLLWWNLDEGAYASAEEARAVRGPAAAALAVLVAQIALGGWVSANYAALACADLPLCRGALVPPMDFGNAFHVVRELGQTSAGEALPREALVAIHWTHRMFALLVLGVAGWAAWRALRVAALRPVGAALAVLLLLQFSLGVANVATGLPLALAAAHNAGAALLLAALVVLNFFAFRGLRPIGLPPTR
jgi:cytochrome c oxidase assembly protein subunit 15